MATTLNRNETDMFYCQRTFTNESKTGGDVTGDWFRSMWATGIFSASTFNSIVDTYNDNETEADNGTLTGTDPGGNHFSIGGMPSRPRPIHK